jgi:hypothetical protein
MGNQNGLSGFLDRPLFTNDIDEIEKSNGSDVFERWAKLKEKAVGR